MSRSWLLLLVFLLDASSLEYDAKRYYELGRYYQYEQFDSIASIHNYEKSAKLLETETCTFDCGGMFNDLGVLKRSLGDIAGAEYAFRQSLEYSSTSSMALANLAEIQVSHGAIQSASEFYIKAISSDDCSAEINYNYARFLSQYINKREALSFYRKAIQMKPFFPQAYEALGLVSCQLEDFSQSFKDYETALELLSQKPTLSLVDRKLQNRIIFQQALGIIPKMVSSEDEWIEIRKKFLRNIIHLLHYFPLNALTDSKPVESLGCSSIGYYLIYQGQNDLLPRQLFSYLYSRVFYDYLQPYLSFLPSSYSFPTNPIPTSSKKIRIGFLSAFFCHHSVGLLLQGVIKNLSRDAFHVITFFLPPIKSDVVSESIYDSSDEAVLLVESELQLIKQQIARRNLDILVFGEIGMDLTTYLLAFSRLGSKSLVFWGHAITSGIVDFKSSVSLPRLTEEMLNSSGSRLISSATRIGPDYFVSSVLFENHLSTPSMQQQRYSERLILQEGLTTYFEEPPTPLVSNLQFPDKLEYISAFLSRLHLVETTFPLAYLTHIIKENNLNTSDLHLYGVPQTLYKLSPQMVHSIKQVLLNDPNGLLFVPEGAEVELASHAIHQFQRSLSMELASRVLFLRQMNGQEFITLCSLFDVVMDTFPVGGGRSSFEIFSTGTPIVVFYSGTSILQLTYGMYRTMGIDESCCVRYSLDEYIALTIEMAQNHTFNHVIRSQILQSKSRLYRNQSVLQEWEDMLHYIHNSPRPVPFYSHSSSLIYPYPNPTDTVHPHIVSDLQTIQKFNFSQTERIPEEFFFALSIPYIDPPLRVKDLMPSVNYDITSRLYQV